MSKFKNGLLLVHQAKLQNIHSVLKEASQLVEKKLYIDFFQSFAKSSNHVHSKNDYFYLLSTVYSRPKELSYLDMQVLLPSCNRVPCIRNVEKPVDILLVQGKEQISSSTDLTKLTTKKITCSNNMVLKVVGDEKVLDSNAGLPEYNFDFSKQYSGVVIGGTFDRIHDGHKVLIQTALLLAEKKLTVGVADGPLIEKKILKELIEPIEKRIQNVMQLIEESKPGIEQKVVSITDPCGPSGIDDDLQLLVVSEETIKGGPVVNETRQQNGLPQLDVMNIDLVGETSSDLSNSLNAEGKVSSSAGRVRELGRLLRQPNKPKEDGKCYVIGVTGGIASGKSSVVKRFEQMGAFTVDCDLLGHKAYNPGETAYKRVVEEFGADILNDDGTINRRKLGPIVFADKQKLELLNSIVWPEIHRMKQEIIDEVSREGKHNIVVFEGAVLFEAGWDQEANEVWCCIIPKDEAVKRIMDRNKFSEQEALKRIASQMTNEERVCKSHVVLSTLWEREFTQKQCEKAWALLNQRIGIDDKKPQASL